MKIIYIAGPYTKGDVAVNVKNAMDCANELMDQGFAPFCPHLSHYLHINNPRPYQDWIDMDNAFVTKCDYMIRLEGESAGADAEVKLARKHGIPVYTLKEFKENV
jgi:hypothetical protein